jgi:hypothetical protein
MAMAAARFITGTGASNHSSSSVPCQGTGRLLSPPYPRWRFDFPRCAFRVTGRTGRRARKAAVCGRCRSERVLHRLIISMNFRCHFFPLRPQAGRVWVALLIFWSAAANPAAGIEIWTGPPVNFVNEIGSDPTLPSSQDRLTPNVWLTRGATKGLYNAAVETSYSSLSPIGTEWAYGLLANYASLNYQPWVKWNGNNPPSMVGQDAVLHVIPDDTYLAIQFTFWNVRAGGFSYTRSTPPVPEPSGGMICALGLLGFAAVSRSLRRPAVNTHLRPLFAETRARRCRGCPRHGS